MKPAPQGYSRGFLVAASAYRRQARERKELDFGPDALRAQYEHESRGAPRPDPHVNGFTCGKWILDATIKAMREDHAAGHMTKHELMRGSSAFVRRAVRQFPTHTFGGY